MAWYNSSWTYRQKVTIDATKVDEVFQVFPLYTSRLNLDFFDNAKAGAADVRITQADGTTEIARYIVAHDATAHTGCILVDVHADVSISTNTDYWVYYGNSGASDHAASATYGRNAVFNSQAGAYMPGMTLTDLTGAGRDLTAVGTPTTAASGYEGITAAVYNGTSQYHYNSGTQAISGWPITHELLAYAANVTGNKVLSGYAYSTTTHSYSGMYLNGGASICTHKGATGTVADASKSTVSATTWTYLSGTRDANTGTTKSYINGGTAATGTGTLTTPSAFDRFQIGAQYTGGAVANYTNGRVAVVLLSNSVRSANYINTMYNAWSSSSFFTAGEIETQTGGTTGWVIASAGSNVSNNSTDWVNPGNITADDGTSATCAPAGFDDTDWLRATFDLSTLIPSGATIDGVKVRYQASRSAAGPEEGDLYLVIGGASELGANRSTFTAITATPTNYDRGGVADLWSLSISRAQAVATNFGFQVFFTDADSSSETVSVDAMWINVHFTTASGANLGSFFWGR